MIDPVVTRVLPYPPGRHARRRWDPSYLFGAAASTSARRQPSGPIPKSADRTSGPSTALVNGFTYLPNAERLPKSELNVAAPRQEQLECLLEQPDRRHDKWNAERQQNYRDAQHQRNDKEDTRQ